MGIPTDGLEFFLPLHSVDMQSAIIQSKDVNQYSCSVIGVTWDIKGASFDANDDYIVLTSPAFATSPQGTIGIFFKPTGSLEQHLFTFAKLSSGVVDEFKMEYRGAAGDYYCALEVHDNGVFVRDLRTQPSTAAINTWHSFFLTSDSSVHRVFIDKVEITSFQTDTGSNGIWLGDLTTDANQITLGALPRSNLYLNDFGGLMGAALVYSRPIVSSDVDSIHDDVMKAFKTYWDFYSWK